MGVDPVELIIFMVDFPSKYYLLGYRSGKPEYHFQVIRNCKQGCVELEASFDIFLYGVGMRGIIWSWKRGSLCV